MKNILLIIFIIWLSACETRSQSAINSDNKNTYVFIAGVLAWENGLDPFEKKNRKDQELYNQFKKMGVPESNMVLLLDTKATLKNIKTELETLCSKAGEGSTLIFYYAGHGMKDKKGKTFFANFDINPDVPDLTGLDVSLISSTINSKFKGSTVFLTADCCYSGALMGEGEKIKNKKVLVSTSATSSNTSTRNWTFSQTMIDCLSGLPLADRNNDGIITAGEWKLELMDAMKYREQQQCGFKLFNLPETYFIAKAIGRHPSTGDNEFTAGCYVRAMNGSKKETARITAKVGNDYSCEFYNYSDKKNLTLTKDKLIPVHFISYPTGSEVEVLWSGEYYKAKI